MSLSEDASSVPGPSFSALQETNLLETNLFFQNRLDVKPTPLTASEYRNALLASLRAADESQFILVDADTIAKMQSDPDVIALGNLDLMKCLRYAKYCESMHVPSRLVASYVKELSKASNYNKDVLGEREATRWLLTRLMLQQPDVFFGAPDEASAAVGEESTTSAQAKGWKKERADNGGETAGGETEGRVRSLNPLLTSEILTWCARSATLSRAPSSRS
jgi:hypothetical protein